MAYRSFFVSSLLFFLLISGIALGQITSSNADFTAKTSFGDSYFLFCGSKNSANGTLTATISNGVKSSFIWEKYDTISASFQFYENGATNDTITSTKRNLDDGCYRVTINDGSSSYSDQAWVLNNWIEVTKTEIPDSSSNCTEFKILAEFESAPLRVFNTQNNNAISIRNKTIDLRYKYKWTRNGEIIRSSLNPIIYPPIPSETSITYDLEITDEFECPGKGKVDYNSKVTKAEFLVDPMQGEAVLQITTSNTSINADSTIWYFYKDNSQIAREIEAADVSEVDSVDFILYDKSPIYEYERCGNYRIKLVTVHVNDTGNCYDTFNMTQGTFIQVDTSLIEVPKVFTPNGDGQNDVFVIKSISLKSLTIKIYNRWGGLVHSWKYSNIRSRDYTYEHSVWDGRIGNRMATPGVYFYVIRAVGRDLEDGHEKQIKKQGFFHLFRGK